MGIGSRFLSGAHSSPGAVELRQRDGLRDEASSDVRMRDGPCSSIGGSRALRLTIGSTTTGRTPSISVAAPPPGPSGWQAFNPSLAHRAAHLVGVTFRPTGNAIVQNTLLVTSDTARSPHTIGRSRKRSAARWRQDSKTTDYET